MISSSYVLKKSHVDEIPALDLPVMGRCMMVWSIHPEYHQLICQGPGTALIVLSWLGVKMDLVMLIFEIHMYVLKLNMTCWLIGLEMSTRTVKSQVGLGSC